MANMVYCYLNVTAPTKEKLEEFVKECTDSDLDTLLAQEKKKCRFYLTEKSGPFVNFYRFQDNTIFFDFDVKWAPPIEEMRAMTHKYHDFNFELESWQEFHEFIYDMTSGPDYYTEKYKKLSSEEIDKIMNENYYSPSDLVKRLASISESALEEILEQVKAQKEENKVVAEKHKFIASKIDNLSDSQINKIYNILNAKTVVIKNDDDEEDDIAKLLS